jgi:site-specific DNA-cytosine methylase
VRIGSLFSGILGLELGLHWAFAEAGISTDIVWTVERDSFARSVIARWAPNAMQFDDVRMVGARELDQVDLISLGFPCTDISDAGKQEGIDGKASGLWSHGRRIIKELAPTFVVVENVAALHRRGLVTVLGNLAALGYDAEWHSFTASDVGAPHRRARMFIIAWRAMANGHGDGQRWQRAGDERDDRNTHEPRRNDADGCSEALANANSSRRNSGRGAGRERPRFAEPAHGAFTSLARLVADVPKSSVGDVPDGFPARLARWPAGRHQAQFEWEPPRTIDHIDAPRLRALGNAVVPEAAYVVGRRLLQIKAGLEK